GRRRFAASDRGAAGTLDARHSGSGAKLARYVARLREREAAFAAALRRVLEPLPVGRADGVLTPELRRQLADLQRGASHAPMPVGADPQAAADRIAELESALAGLIARVERTGGGGTATSVRGGVVGAADRSPGEGERERARVALARVRAD